MNEQILKDLPLFKDLSADEIFLFIKTTGANYKNYLTGERILKTSRENFFIGVMVEGEAQVISEDRLGNEVVGHKIEVGALLGTTSAILGIENFTSIETLKPSKVLWIPYRSLIGVGVKLGRIHGVVMKNFLESFCKKNLLMMQKIELLSQRTLREKIILYLIQKRKAQKNLFVTIPGRVQMAKELECNRSSLTRELAQMEAEKILFFDGNKVSLDDEKIR